MEIEVMKKVLKIIILINIDMREPIDILVVHFNRIKYIKIYLLMIHLFTKYPFRLIVVDNGSTDGSKKWLLEMKKKGLIWKIVFNKENKPLAEAFAEGFKEVESKYFITSPNDIIVPYKKYPYGKDVCWLTMLVATIKYYDTYGSVNFYALRQGFEPFRVKRWKGVKELADKNKLEKLHKIIYADRNNYGLIL